MYLRIIFLFKLYLPGEIPVTALIDGTTLYTCFQIQKKTLKVMNNLNLIGDMGLWVVYCDLNPNMRPMKGFIYCFKSLESKFGLLKFSKGIHFNLIIFAY